ncbi:hypothetical protein DY000_02053474 [Brassica cretica]|uniref:MADS-box domain-containing protein n=1 Tax=Brassica cretica TaxID=69181 RepID=A0ABQ7ADT6_BRACR|nr:hypothetical protein DY000_02053474 [Brassica cretica]
MGKVKLSGNKAFRRSSENRAKTLVKVLVSAKDLSILLYAMSDGVCTEPIFIADTPFRHA